MTEKSGFPMRTLRQKVHYANKGFKENQPVAIIKVGEKIDYVTAAEFLEALYGRKVDRIIFSK